MNILIAGASGFIGHALVSALQPTHQITVLGRNQKKLSKHFKKTIQCHTWDELPTLNAHDFDAVINLCGENIASARWSKAVKARLISSRVKTSQTLINWLITQKAKPHFYCANAVGIYGVQANGDETLLDEDTPIHTENPPDFLSEIAVAWQAALAPAIAEGIPVVTTRFGVVLKRSEGMLKKLAPSFFMGLGSRVGDGRQYLSWVHIDDVVGVMKFLLSHPGLTGAFNVTAPDAVPQKQFAKTLAHAMHRPLLLTMPAFAVKLLFGEMGEYLLLKGQRVAPKRLLEEGYAFQYPELGEALEHEFQ